MRIFTKEDASNLIRCIEKDTDIELVAHNHVFAYESANLIMKDLIGDVWSDWRVVSRKFALERLFNNRYGKTVPIFNKRIERIGG